MDKDWITFHVPVGCAKLTSHAQFISDKSTKAYQKHDQNIFCFGIFFLLQLNRQTNWRPKI